MKEFTKFWHKPRHQRKGKPEVQFHLQPLDQRTLYILQQSIGRRGPDVDGATAAFEFAVVGWQGLDEPFSQAAKDAVLNGVGGMDWTLWLADIAGTLYRRAILGEPEAKNS